MGAKLFYADWLTNMKLTVAFRNFAKAPNFFFSSEFGNLLLQILIPYLGKAILFRPV